VRHYCPTPRVVEGPASFNNTYNRASLSGVTPGAAELSSLYEFAAYTGAMPHPSRTAEFAAGVRAELPLLLGVSPFGMAYGAYAIESGLSAPLSQAMSVIVFGGASQFVGTQMMAAGEAGLIIVLVSALVNLRHMLYSASLAPHVDHLPLRWRVPIAYLLTDEGYAVAATRYEEEEKGAPYRHWFVLGALLALWVCWQATTAIGIVAGQQLPESWSLDFALVVTFIAIVVPMLRDRPALAAAVIAALVAVAGFDWPYRSGLFAAAVAGMAAGLALERVGGPRAAGEAP
jgi:4-azaleucine resistance transporter AzlC